MFSVSDESLRIRSYPVPSCASGHAPANYDPCYPVREPLRARFVRELPPPSPISVTESLQSN